MDKLQIKGGYPLNGVVKISGAKNAVLPILASALLCKNPVMISNIPHLNDVSTMLDLLNQLGAKVTILENRSLELNCNKVHACSAPYDLVKTMRASILTLGPLLARFGKAEIPLPGGCAIGSRPVDMHIEGMEALGADIKLVNGFIQARAKGNRLKGTNLNLEKIIVTGTENLMMAAVLAEGETQLRNAACEPEIFDLANFLNSLGADISGAGTPLIRIKGVQSLDLLQKEPYEVLPDRIEAGTYLIAAAMTRGKIRIKQVVPKTLESVLLKLEEAGANLEIGSDWISLDMYGKQPKAVSLETAPYPDFPTDMQAQFVALNAVALGEALITENVFENRFMHVAEMKRMGAKLKQSGNRVYSKGQPHLISAPVMATDLRASAGLVLAALMAKGETLIDQIYHIDRGYECIEEKLSQLGAKIRRVE